MLKHLPDILIGVIPHKEQRYDTCGDYFKINRYPKSEVFSISKLSDPDYEFLVLIHEMIEWYLTEKNGIKEKKISNFDINFQGEGEPGDSKEAPYYQEHQFATSIEKQIASKLGVTWSRYSQEIVELNYGQTN